jgi:chromosomal replication initiation ATPase DnaA
MALNRASIADVVEVFRFVRGETGSDESALYAAMRMFSINRDGAVERTPVRLILETVCAFYGVPLDALLGRRRTGMVARARQVAMALLRSTGSSVAEAGEHLGRSKGAAECACRHVEADGALKEEAAAIAERVAQRVGSGGRRLPIILPAEAAR